ncbi:MAG: glycosyltransferase domain-containing protein [Candidatus Binataceae bacterium]
MRRASRVGAWRVIYVRHDPKLHPRMQAKWFKLLSHRIFPRGRLAWRYAPFSLRRRADLGRCQPSDQGLRFCARHVRWPRWP